MAVRRGSSCEGDETFVHKWGSLLVLSLALAIILIDATLLNVSLKAIIGDLRTDIQKVQWVITAYSLMLAAFTITGGRVGDLFGRKRMFMMGAVLFGIGSLIASLSINVPMLIAGESIIEGVGAALMMPATASLLVSKFHGRDRALAFGVWGGVAGASTAIGPLLGGWLTTNYSWRWGFRINLFVVMLLLVGSVLIDECRDQEERPDLDWVGVALSSAGLFALVFGIIESSTYGWWRAKAPFTELGMRLTLGGYSVTPFAVAIGLAFLAGFVAWERHVERRGGTPLVSLHLFGNRQFVSGATVTAVVAMGQAGLIFSIPVFLQAVRGADAFHTGLALLPSSAAAFVAAPTAAALTQRFPARRLIQLGLALNVVSYVLLYSTLSVGSSPLSLAPALLIQGAGLGIVLAQTNNLTLSAVSVQQAGEAAGVNNTGRQLGATMGTAVVGALLIGAIGTGLTSGIESSTAIPARLKPMIASIVSAQSSAVEFGGGARVPAAIPLSVRQEITRVSKRSITQANRLALLVGSVIAVLGLIVSLGLPAAPAARGQSAAARPDARGRPPR